MDRPIYIRKLTTADAEIYKNISYGESLHRYVSFMEAKSISEAERIISFNTCLFSTMYGIFRASDNKLVGALITSWYEPDSEITVHYFVGEYYRRKHYAYESLIVLSRLVKQKYPEVKTLLFEVRKTNKASIALQKALGSELVKENDKIYFYYLSV